jgi:hypothetical protein
VARVVTTFTAAHSLTLAASALGGLSVPAVWVEPLIAASIVYVAGLNLLEPGRARERLAATFGFGLVHGLGFAGTLADLGVGGAPGGAALPLFAFNVGVEAGQLAVAGAVLPALAQLRHYPRLQRVARPAASLCIGLCGVIWLLERTLFAR